MQLDPRKLILVCFLLSFTRLASAQSIAFQPGLPTSDQSVIALLTEPFNCAAPQPVLADRSANTLTIESLFPNGIVNCPFVPFPPPTSSRFGVSLGMLAPGKYAVTWNLYLAQSSGMMPTLLASKSTSLVVSAAPGPGAGGGPAPLDPLPALSSWAMLALGSLCAALGARRLRG